MASSERPPDGALAHSLTAMLTAELTDNAGWELLIALCDDAGEDDIGDRFRLALAEEEQHLLTVRSWVVALATANTASVAT